MILFLVASKCFEAILKGKDVFYLFGVLSAGLHIGYDFLLILIKHECVNP